MQVIAGAVAVVLVILGVAFWAVGRKARLGERLKQTEESNALRDKQGAELRENRGRLSGRLDNIMQDDGEGEA